jgi:hypothetical protein
MMLEEILLTDKYDCECGECVRLELLLIGSTVASQLCCGQLRHEVILEQSTDVTL